MSEQVKSVFAVVISNGENDVDLQVHSSYESAKKALDFIVSTSNYIEQYEDDYIEPNINTRVFILEEEIYD